MSIFVVCPGCHKRFSVSDKFAGKSGPCPQCKTVIKVPRKEDEVTVHAPDDFSGGRGVSGQLVLKPIGREKTELNPVVASSIAGAVLTVVLATWLMGRAGLFEDNRLIQAIGLLLVSPPLVVAGYAILRSGDDLAPYRGKALYIRSGICSLVYIALWWFYAQTAEDVLTGELWNWAFFAPPFFVVGALAALACLDFDFGTGFLHYCFYLFATVLLRSVAGLGWVWEIPEDLIIG